MSSIFCPPPVAYRRLPSDTIGDHKRGIYKLWVRKSEIILLARVKWCLPEKNSVEGLTSSRSEWIWRGRAAECRTRTAASPASGLATMIGGGPIFYPLVRWILYINRITITGLRSLQTERNGDSFTFERLLGGIREFHFTSNPLIAWSLLASSLLLSAYCGLFWWRLEKDL